MIDRREFFSLLATIPLVASARAQQRRPLLAILSPAAPDAAVIKLVNEPLKQTLAKLGWESGRNIELVERYADHDESRLPRLAAELVALRPDVVFTNTSYAATVVARATSDIPIVVGPAGEHVLLDLAGGSLARPTKNVTGFVLTSPEIDDKCVTMLFEAVPTIRRLGVLTNPRNPGQSHYPVALKAAMSVAGKTLVRIEASGLTDLDAALTQLASERVDALFVADDSHIAGAPDVRQRVLGYTAALGIPVASSHLGFGHDGALLVMGPSIPVLAAAAAGYVDKILKGSKAVDLPIQLPTVFTVIVNRKTAMKLGITIPPIILIRADEVLE